MNRYPNNVPWMRPEYTIGSSEPSLIGTIGTTETGPSDQPSIRQPNSRRAHHDHTTVRTNTWGKSRPTPLLKNPSHPGSKMVQRSVPSTNNKLPMPDAVRTSYKRSPYVAQPSFEPNQSIKSPASPSWGQAELKRKVHPPTP